MSVFGKIMDKILGRKDAAPASPSAAAVAPAAPAVATAAAAPRPAVAPAATPSAAPVDVEAVLTQMAGSGGGNWRTSIVDLLKLLGLDSSLSERKELAEELGVHAGEHGSAEQNIALHKAVMAKLAENGGVVPDSLRN